MKLVPLLALQRSIYNVPMPNRFQAYLDTMLLDNRQDIRYPWSNVNPMAKPHIPDLLDRLIQMQVEEEIQESSSLFQEVDGDESKGDWSVGLVVVDDVLGGWTDRFDVEFQNSFQQVEPMLKRKWVEVIVWASDYCDASSDGGSIEILMDKESHTVKEKLLDSTERSIYRFLYHHHQRKGEQRTGNDSLIVTLGDMMDQESWVQEQLGRHEKTDDAKIMLKETERSFDILKEYKTETIVESFPTVFAAYYGDEAAEKLGYPPLGMGTWSGQRISASGLWTTS